MSGLERVSSTRSHDENPRTQPPSRSISERDVCPSTLGRLPPSTCRSSTVVTQERPHTPDPFFHSSSHDKPTVVAPAFVQDLSVLRCARVEAASVIRHTRPLFCPNMPRHERPTASTLPSHVTHCALSLVLQPNPTLLFFLVFFLCVCK